MGLILPSGNTGQCPEAILLLITGRHLVSIGQWPCSTPHRAQDTSAYHKEGVWPKCQWCSISAPILNLQRPSLFSSPPDWILRNFTDILLRPSPSFSSHFSYWITCFIFPVSWLVFGVQTSPPQKNRTSNLTGGSGIKYFQGWCLRWILKAKYDMEKVRREERAGAFWGEACLVHATAWRYHILGCPGNHKYG